MYTICERNSMQMASMPVRKRCLASVSPSYALGLIKIHSASGTGFYEAAGSCIAWEKKETNFPASR